MRANKAWNLTISSSATAWTNTGAGSRANKPVADLLWSSSQAGTYTALSATATTVTSGAAATAGKSASVRVGRAFHSPFGFAATVKGVGKVTNTVPVFGQVAAGDYTVVATIDDPNYTGTNTYTFTIDPATATLTLSGLDATYDESFQTSIFNPATGSSVARTVDAGKRLPGVVDFQIDLKLHRIGLPIAAGEQASALHLQLHVIKAPKPGPLTASAARLDRACPEISLANAKAVNLDIHGRQALRGKIKLANPLG